MSYPMDRLILSSEENRLEIAILVLYLCGEIVVLLSNFLPTSTLLVFSLPQYAVYLPRMPSNDAAHVLPVPRFSRACHGPQKIVKA